MVEEPAGETRDEPKQIWVKKNPSGLAEGFPRTYREKPRAVTTLPNRGNDK